MGEPWPTSFVRRVCLEAGSHLAPEDFVNDEFETAVAQLLAILRGGGMEYDAKRPDLKPLLADLLA